MAMKEDDKLTSTEVLMLFQPVIDYLRSRGFTDEEIARLFTVAAKNAGITDVSVRVRRKDPS